MAQTHPGLEFLRAIPPAERQRSQSEFLAALESRVTLLRYYGRGKNHNMSKKANRFLFLRLFEAALTTPGAHPPAVCWGFGKPLKRAFTSFWSKICMNQPPNRLFSSVKEPALDAALGVYLPLQMLDVGMHDMTIISNELQKYIIASSRSIDVLNGLWDRDQHDEVAAEMRGIWPESTLTLADLLGCAYYVRGAWLARTGRIDEAMPDFEAAMELPSTSAGVQSAVAGHLGRP
jgi:hypothetical protein